jgi:ribosome biogenesis GTPase A
MTTIQWFPGHMAKARRQVSEQLKKVDVVMELLDARIPHSSRNPMMEEIIRDKARLIVLTREDLADPEKTAAWVRHFRGQDLPAVPVDAMSGQHLNDVVREARKLAESKMAVLAKRGIRPRAVRAMILGIPNVGKSSLINRLARRSAAKTGDRPGVTRAQQWIKVGTDFELLDTPGILWPKFDDPRVGLRLAATGAIKDEMIDPEPVAAFILQWLPRAYPGLLEQRYKLETLPETVEELLTRIGEKRGYIRGGGVVDTRGVAELVVREFRSGIIGRVTLELPDDAEEFP